MRSLELYDIETIFFPEQGGRDYSKFSPLEFENNNIKYTYLPTNCYILIEIDKFEIRNVQRENPVEFQRALNKILRGKNSELLEIPLLQKYKCGKMKPLDNYEMFGNCNKKDFGKVRNRVIWGECWKLEKRDVDILVSYV